MDQNYISEMPSSQGTGEKIYGRSGGRRGCFTIFAFIILLLIVVLAGYFFLLPSLQPNKIRGDLLDMTYVPGKDNSSGKLWILTDGSFTYIQKTSSPGKTSIGRKGLFCKTYTYIYDPIEKKVLKEFKTNYDDLPPKPKLFYQDGIIWMVSTQQFSYEPMITIYNAETAEEIMDTKAFVNKHPQLSSGMSNLYIDENPKRFRITTHDGQNLIYLVGKDTIFSGDQDYRKYMESTSKGDVTIFTLAEEKSGSGPRKKLYRATGPADKLLAGSITESVLNNPESMKFFYNATSVPLTTNKIYLEGLILYQDADAVIIIHQSQIGKNADRMLTCVAADGREMWTIPPEQLFPELAVTEKDAFSVIFFVKDKMSAQRSGDVVIFKFEPAGSICFDFKTGKKLWTISL